MGNPQDRGDLGLREILESREGQDGALRRREFGERVQDARRPLALGGILRRISGWIRELVGQRCQATVSASADPRGRMVYAKLIQQF